METLISKLWIDYINLNPQAQEIYNLVGNGKRLVNDHIAFRTFQNDKIGVAALSNIFNEKGYHMVEEYNFEKKKLYAIHMEHENKTLPRVFISELLLNKFSEKLNNIVKELLLQVNEVVIPGKPWKSISYENYKILAEESEYAAWVAAFGFRANHFTISVDNVEGYNIESMNKYLKEQGFKLNDKGGEVKGSIEQGLQQSSTMAPSITWTFSDGVFTIPGCYCEFAERHQVDGKLFSGFITESADKIFESTYTKA